MFTFTNVSLMPSYLSKPYFDDWFEKFNQSLVKIGLSTLNFYKINISIKFSNEKKKKRYGSLTIKELKEFIRNIWGENKEIEKILDRINTYDDYRNLLQELMGAIYRIYPDRECHNPEELHSLLNDLEFETPILGEYINDRKLIVFYTCNIEKAADEHAPKKHLCSRIRKGFYP